LKAGVAGEPKIAAPAPEEPLVLPGVVIEEIPKGSALEKAGLQVGDVILSWQRLPNPPANPEATEGVLTSYFDWLELEVEQVPRGAVRLHGLRGGTPRELRIEPGIWNAKVRPVLPPALAKIFERGKDHLAARDFERAAETWRTLANNVPAGDVRELRAWVLLQIGEAWGKNREWQKSLEAAKGALAAARSAGAQMAAWEAIGGVYERSNDPESAKRAYQSADEVINKLGSKELRSARSHTNLGAMAWGRGDLRRAYDLFERALAIREKLAPRSLELAASLNDLGVLNVAIGDLKSANELLKRSLALREQLAPGSLVMADSLSNLGAAARAQGDLSRAVDYYTQALQVRQARAPNGLEAANSLSSLGIVAWSRGDLDSARYYFLNALSIETAYAPLGDRMAASLNNLGLVAASRRELDRAKEYFLQAQQIQSNLAPARTTGKP
jgi:tetratricopeptide (TPR) repeat protein